ncbi:MAG: TIGR04219 family outer membrane beta-barrel protein [Campylobacterota bacterium]|nr:TIGR04219 family outer membrane beta-barrel protein [Campylobacterota bacterium]
MKKITLSMITASTLLVTSSSAFMGITAEVGAGIYQPSLSGTIAYDGSNIDFGDLGTKEETTTSNNYLYAEFRHFVPIIPNARVEKLTYSIPGSATLSTPIDFAGQTYTANTNIKSDIELEQTDMILYWGVPLVGTLTAGILDLNFGLDAKNISGTINLSNGTNNESSTFDETLPLLYLNARVDVPFTPVELSATTKTISYDGSSISDNEAKLSITLPLPIPLIDFKFDLGYKSQNINIDDNLVDNLNADITTDGIFYGISAKF